MASWLVNVGFCYVGYFLEVALFVFLFWRGQWTRLVSVFLYVAALFGIDGLMRPLVLHRYGLESREYIYAFYLSDFFLALAAFLLVCSFFRRACKHEEKMWRQVRLMLVTVFIVVLGYTAVSLSRHYADLGAWNFIVEFEQNVYFTCLVLNTMLYLLMQHIASTDEELELLVCGIGIQFAAPAASWALFFLTRGVNPALHQLILPVCNAGMLLTWFYAISHPSKAVSKLPAKGKFALLAQATLTKM
jgi:hypothetical protein